MKQFVLAALTIALTGCGVTDAVKDTATDANQLANLKNVEIKNDASTDPVTVKLIIPEFTPGETFAEMKAIDSAKYCTPANYGAEFTVNLLADNSKENSGDAKFDGMAVLIGMDTTGAEPIATKADGFTIAKGTKQAVRPNGSMNLATHRVAGLYLFSRVAYSTEFTATEAVKLAYKLGTVADTIRIDLPKATIPTRADDEKKKFLKDAIEAGIFNE